MKERPIPFTAPEVRALLAGTKTQTRRVVDPRSFAGKWLDAYACENVVGAREFVADPENYPPFVAGMRLWVRETWASDVPGCPGGLSYRADHLDPRGDGPANPMRWRSSTQMPRSASRITLEVTNVRVERLQDISEEDARAEGLRGTESQWGVETCAVDEFQRLWDSINGKPGKRWEDNPWVWVVGFRRLYG